MVERDTKYRQVPKFAEDHLLLSGDRVFFTVQGEGPTIGMPAIFIRTHICNLSCDWSKAGGEICDAWYTWKKESDEYWTEHELFSYKELYNTVKKFRCNRLVFTGGEPLLQQNRIVDFLKFMYATSIHGDLKIEWTVEIETNGTIELSNDLSLFTYLQINCSPKLSSSSMSLKHRINFDALDSINRHHNSNFKFVVTSSRDLEEIDSIVINGNLDPRKVIIMPEGTSPEILTKRMQELVDIVRDRGWRLIPRLQCFIWGNKRGV